MAIAASSSLARQIPPTDGGRFLSLVPDHGADALGPALTHAASRPQPDRTGLLVQLSTTIASDLELRDLIRLVSARVRTAMRCHGVGVMLSDPATGRLGLYAFDAPGTAGMVLEEIAGSRPAPAAVFRTGDPVVTRRLDVAGFTSDAAYRLACHHDVRAVCDVPLISRGRIVGVLVLSSQNEDAFGTDDVDFMVRAAGQIALAVENALAHDEIRELKETLAREKVDLDDEVSHELNFEEIVGKSVELRRVLKQVETVASTDSTVLIYGETGTGKELIARAIHKLSRRRAHAFVRLNCAAIPAGLQESELFGHEKGAFTGAIAQRVGRFELANRGTVFLDEVGEIALDLQAKLLRVLQEGVVTRIGGAKSIQVDVRVLAATNKDLESEIADGRFREDLLYRLNVVPIEVPPLRERLEDIPALVEHFAEQLAAGAGVPGKKFAEDAVRRLQSRPWPGNIRELRNAVERALILASGKVVTAADIERLLPPGDGVGGGVGDAQTFEGFKQEAEKSFLIQKLREHDWNVSETARALKMPRSNLYKKIERYGLNREQA